MAGLTNWRHDWRPASRLLKGRLSSSSKDIQGLSSQLQEGLEKVMGMIGRLQPSKRMASPSPEDEPPGLRPKAS